MNQEAEVLDGEISSSGGVLDEERFNKIHRFATVLAQSSMVPDSLCKAKDKDQNKEVELPFERVVANCFLVVEAAERWQVSPFTCLASASVVHGKLCWEGKFIAALLDAKLGIELDYQYAGSGESMSIRVSGVRPGRTEPDYVDGSVKQWKPTKNPWLPDDYKKRLAYRGAREWARVHKPALILGVYSPDEMSEVEHDVRAARAKDVTGLAEKYRPKEAQGAPGFNASEVQKQLTDARQVPMEILKDKEPVLAQSQEVSAPKERATPQERATDEPKDERAKPTWGLAADGIHFMVHTAGIEPRSEGLKLTTVFEFLSRATAAKTKEALDEAFKASAERAPEGDRPILIAVRSIHSWRLSGILDQEDVRRFSSEFQAWLQRAPK